MASGAGYTVYTGTTAASVDTVIMTAPGSAVKVTNVSGAGVLYATISWPGGPCPPPTIGGNNVYAAASVPNASFSTRTSGQFGTVVQLISNAPTLYTVEIQSSHSTS